MAVCNIQGKSDMYGLGIRLGFYFLWYAAIFARWMAPSEIKPVAFTTNVFVAGAFLSLIIHTATDVNDLEPVETYIVLLLAFGAYLALVPIYVWRLLTGCDAYWDPTRHPRVNLGPTYANISISLLVGILIYQYWFWFARVPSLDHRNCQQYGFIFGQVRLNSKVSVVLHALMYFWLGLVCLYLLFMKLRAVAGIPDPGSDRARRAKKAHIEFLQNLDVWIRIVVALGVTVAVELTLSWNEIEGVNSLVGVGQTIPFAVGTAAIVRVFYVAMVYRRVKVGRAQGRQGSVRRGSESVSSRRRSQGDTESGVSRPSRVKRR